jgi:membrane associated rhomboid family serine protease
MPVSVAGDHAAAPPGPITTAMGFQDRGYYRQSPRPFASDWSGVSILIALNVGVWMANFILSGDLFREFFPLRVCLNDIFSLHTNLTSHPWNFWQLLTYGFLHDGPSLELQEKLRAFGRTQNYSPFHLIGNMLMLFFFGREVEGLMGRAEFLRFYCTAIIMAGLFWVVGEQFQEPGINVRLVGASGGVMAVLAVFIWHFPQQIIYFWGVLPVPVWALGVLYIAIDFGGALGGAGGARDAKLVVAHVAHLAGAVFGLLYAWRGWTLEDLGTWTTRLLQRRPRMRVVHPDAGRTDDDEDEASLHEAVDRILAKISRSGESSLTPEERATLTRASRRLKDRSR